MPQLTWTRRLPLIALLTVLVALLGAPPHPLPLRAAPATVQITVLPNGLTVGTREISDAETVTIAVSVGAGGRDEPEALRGGSHLIEHMHFLGTARYPTPEALFGAISAVGGEINASTGAETTTYFATVPASRFATPLDVLAEMVQRSTFPAAEVERERGVVQEELRGEQRGGLEIATETLAEALLGPAGQGAGGTVASVADMRREDLLAYRARRYVAGNIAVTVAGPLAHAAVVAAVSAAFAALPAGGPRSPIPLPPASPALRLEGESPFAPVVLVGERIPGLDSEDAAALLVLDALLDTPGTRMRDALRRARVPALAGGTRIQQFSDVGLWAAFAVADPEQVNRVADVVRTQIRRLQSTPVADEELDAARRYLSGRVLLSGERTEAQARRMASLLVLGVYTSEEEFSARIMAVTAADIQRAAQTHLDPDALSILAQR